MTTTRLPLAWTVGCHAAAESEPERWILAQVPGAVQLDWAAANQLGDPRDGENWRNYLWAEDVYWTYRAHLATARLGDGERLWFVCGGVDYRCEVLFDGAVIHAQEGMFAPIELDLTDRASDGGELRVRVFPAPKSRPTPADRDQANRSCKPAVSYGWDFHPRLIPLGIWQETFLVVRPVCHLADDELSYRLDETCASATVVQHVRLSQPMAAAVRWTLQAPDGRTILERVADVRDGVARIETALPDVTLWWPHDHGAPARYASRVELLDAEGRVVDARSRRVGFRRVRLVMHEGAWSWPNTFPKSRSHPPITLEVNGRRIFAKGSNWVGPDIFPGVLDADRYRPLLDLSRASHMNLLRCWGGAPVQKDAFFDLCDELGLMIWQEFPLACNCYPDDDDYLRVLDAESRAIIRRLKPHPCVVLWCGGNELFNAWSRMTDQSLALRLLDRNCFELDPSRPFLPTSPVDGMGHGHYRVRDRDEDCWAIFQRAACTAYTEFGCTSPASVEVLREIIPAAELFPPRPGTAWDARHGFNVLGPTHHLCLNVIEHYYGPAVSLAALVAQGQYLQGIGLRGLFEEARRQKPQCAMALNWCLNEPWATAANCSIVSWPCRPKPALAEVAAALRPVAASARIRQIQWRPGDWFDPELWLLSDRAEPVPAGRMHVIIEGGGARVALLTWEFPALDGNRNQRGPRAQYQLPDWQADSFRLLLQVEGRPEWDANYVLLFKPSTPVPTKPQGAPALNV